MRQAGNGQLAAGKLARGILCYSLRARVAARSFWRTGTDTLTAPRRHSEDDEVRLRI
jgi:hypothetical protein